jgi:hypothetical protein
MVDWQFILTALTLVVGGFTLLLVFRQVQIMRRQQETMQSQSSLMERQLQIMQKQDELLYRRAKLELEVDFEVIKREDKSIRGYTFSFYVHNKGNKSAADYYWHILVPFDFSGLQRMEIAGNTDFLQPRSTEQNGLRYSYYCAFASEPVYPTRTILIGEISVGSIPSGKALAVLWKIISEDGAFPDVDYAELEVPLVEVN